MLVLFRAPILTRSGYGEHSRQFVRIINDVFTKNGHDVVAQPTPWGATPFLLGDFNDKPIIDQMISNQSKIDVNKYKPDISIQLILPNEWDPKLALKNIGVTAGVETDRLNPKWVDCCNAMDVVFVPSNHAKKSFISSGIATKPMEVLHEFCDERVFVDGLKCELNFEELTTDFNFLSVGQFTGDQLSDRKNIDKMIRVFCNTFKDSKDVGLVMKINSGGNSLIDRAVSTNRIKMVTSKIRPGKYPKVYLLHGPMSGHEMAQLYRHPKIKCYLTTTRGEGAGLPILESAISGLHIAATNWSGHLDFLGVAENSFTKFDYDLVPTKINDGNIFVNGTCWAEVKEDDCARKLQRIYTSYSWCKKAAETIQPLCRNQFNFENSKKKFVELILKHNIVKPIDIGM